MIMIMQEGVKEEGVKRGTSEEMMKIKRDQKLRTETIILCALSDILIFVYIYYSLYNNLRPMIEKILLMEIFKEKIKEFSPEMVQMLMDKTLVMSKMMIVVMVVFFILFHSLHYWGFYNKKNWAKSYLKTLSWSGVVLSLLFVISIVSSCSYNLFYILPIPIAYFLAARNLTKLMA
ncbi:MAG: hypothetical protein HQK49_04195 [Oligoflexia bacterium]|nr:hypothetical protein [Oligoflexia bacterium]